MKKLFVLLLIIGVAAFVMSQRGGESDEFE